VDANGHPINGMVQLSWTEWTNNAQIALANIGMFHDHNDERYSFNSSGMFSIAGSQNGAEVFVAKGKAMRLNYAMTQSVDSTNFYLYNQANGNWQQQSALQNRQQRNTWQLSNSDEGGMRAVKDTVLVLYKSQTASAQKLEERQVYFLNDDELKKKYSDAEIWSINGIGHEDAAQYSSPEAYSNTLNLSDYLAGERASVDERDMMAAYYIVDAQAFGEYSKEYKMAVDDVAQTLDLAQFGLYNCDQMYRMREPMYVDAQYIDEKGEKIPGAVFFKVMDLDKIGAFTFSAQHFAFDAAARTALLMISDAGDIYICNSKKFAQRKRLANGSFCFELSRVNDKVKKCDDVQKLLGT
jgi:hypothetical protein